MVSRALGVKRRPNPTKFRGQPIIRSPPSGLSTSSARRIMKANKYVKIAKRLGSNSIYRFNEVYSVTASPGVQAAGSVTSPLWGKTAVAGIMAQALSTTTLSGLVTSTTSSWKIMLKSVTTSLTLTNESPGGVEIEIWDVISRANAASSAYLTPIQAWQTGLTDEGGPNTNATTYPGASPTNVKLFNIRWKVLKRTKLEIGTGRTHRHTCYTRLNRIIDNEYFDNYDTVRGVTQTAFCIIKGLPGDTGNTWAVSTNITTSRVKVVGIYDVKYDSQAVAYSPKNMYTGNNLSTNDVYEYDEGDGSFKLATAASTNFG